MLVQPPTCLPDPLLQPISPQSLTLSYSSLRSEYVTRKANRRRPAQGKNFSASLATTHEWTQEGWRPLSLTPRDGAPLPVGQAFLPMGWAFGICHTPTGVSWTEQLLQQSRMPAALTKIPGPGGLGQQTLVSHISGGCEVPDQGTSRFGVLGSAGFRCADSLFSPGPQGVGILSSGLLVSFWRACTHYGVPLPKLTQMH